MFLRARTSHGPAVCLSGQFASIDAEEVMRGRVRLAGLPPADLGPEVDWWADPHGNRSWLGVALSAIERSGLPVPSRLASRRAALEAYITHATQPDGRLAPIGDSPAGTRAPRFAHAEPLVRVFADGYVFGRTAGDDPRSAFYSIRFGRGRRLHGHETTWASPTTRRGVRSWWRRGSTPTSGRATWSGPVRRRRTTCPSWRAPASVPARPPG